MTDGSILSPPRCRRWNAAIDCSIAGILNVLIEQRFRLSCRIFDVEKRQMRLQPLRFVAMPLGGASVHRYLFVLLALQQFVAVLVGLPDALNDRSNALRSTQRKRLRRQPSQRAGSAKGELTRQRHLRRRIGGR